MGAVYAHTNLVNGKVYVGQTQREPWQRWRDQRNEAMRGELKCRYFQSAIRKYGWDAFDHQVLGTADMKEELDNLEKIWILLLRATERKYGYNLTSGGEGGYPSEETRKLMSQKASRRPRPPCSEATRRKISEAQLGISKPMSAEVKKARETNPKVFAHLIKFGQLHKGKKWSEARRAAQERRKELGISTANYSHPGRPAWNKGIKMAKREVSCV
jgi:group I intron endonuclease